MGSEDVPRTADGVGGQTIADSSIARLEALVRVQRLVSETLDPALVAQRIADSLRDLLSARVCTVYRTGERDDDLHSVAVSVDGGTRDGDGIRLLGGTGTVGVAARERRPVATPNVLADTRVRFEADVRDRVERAEFRAVLAVPLVARDRLIGALGVGDTEGRVFSADEIGLTEAFAAQAAQAMDTARLYDEARLGQRSAEIVSGLVSSITASLDLGTVLQRVVDGARELCGADMVRIALRESGSPVVTHQVGVGPAGFETWVRPAVGIGEGSGGSVLATGMAFRTDNYQTDPRISLHFKDRARVLGTIAHMVVPIRTGTRIDGLIYVSRFTPRPFTERDETQLGRLADHAAIAIDNARLHHESERRRRAAEELTAAARMLAESLEPSAVAERIVNGLLGLLHAKSASLRRLEPDGSLVAVAWAGRALAHRRGPGHRTLPGHGGVHRVVTDNQPMWSRDLLAEPGLLLSDEARDMLLGSGDRATLAVPLHTKGAVIGVLTIADDAGREYSAEEVSLAQGFADQAALALENARLFIAEQSTRVDAQSAVTALGESEERYRDLVENASDAVFTLDGHGRFTAVNAATERLTGYGRDELLAMRVRSLLRPDDVERARGHLTAVSDRPMVFECELLARDGHAVRIEVSARRVSRDGQPVSVHGIARDVTERHRQEDELRQAQKMEAIGRLAGGIAHDFNNLLTVIGGRAELLLARLPEGARTHSDAKLVKETAERAAGLTRQLLAFSRRQVLQPAVLDLRTVITGMETLLRRLLGEDVDLVIALPVRLAPVRADRSQLEQVVMNLAVNAREAMPRGGRLTIAAITVESEAMAGGRRVRLSVSDTGHGIDEDTRARVFEPFFTTKASGHSTGLGLATVYGIVAQSGGRVTVESTLGAGTTFMVELPAAGDERPEAPESEPSHDLRGVEWVLLVEDEPAVRDLAYDVLTGLGYRVVAAAGAAEGVTAMRTHAGRIDLVLTDVVMPDGGGREMVDHLRALRDDFKVLYMSGYTDDIVIQRGLVTSEVAFLQKPFTPAGLALRVREVLNS